MNDTKKFISYQLIEIGALVQKKQRKSLDIENFALSNILPRD